MDVAIYASLVRLQDGVWEPGSRSVGLAEGAVGLAMDANNRALITAELHDELESTEFDLVSGAQTVVRLIHPGEDCPYLEFSKPADESP